MVIIELTGCPGVGKSVLERKIDRALQEKGYSRYHARRDWNHFRRLQQLIDKLNIMAEPECVKIKKAGESMITDLEDANRRRWFETVLWQIMLIKKAEKSKADFLVLDEGCIQNISSIDHDSELSESVLKFADYVFAASYASRDIRIVSCELDFDENLKRLTGRNRAGDRFLVGNTDEIAARLNLKKRNGDVLSEKTGKPILRVDTGNSENAVRQIIDFALK